MDVRKMFFLLIAVIQIMLLYLAHVSSSSQQIMATLTHLTGTKLRAKKLYDTGTKSSVLCSAECAEEKACIYITYHEESENCTLFTQGSIVYNLFGLQTYTIDNSTVKFKN